MEVDMNKKDKVILAAVLLGFAAAIALLYAVMPRIGPAFCESDGDCVCGFDARTGDCVLGSRDFYELLPERAAECAERCAGRPVCEKGSCVLVGT